MYVCMYVLFMVTVGVYLHLCIYFASRSYTIAMFNKPAYTYLLTMLVRVEYIYEDRCLQRRYCGGEGVECPTFTQRRTLTWN